MKTVRIAADRAYDSKKTVIPAEVARGVYIRNAPSLQSLKLMHLMIGTAGGRMADEVQHEIRLSDIRSIKGMNNHTRASLTPLFEELRAAVLTQDDPSLQVVRIGGLLDEAIVNYRHEVSGDLLVSWYFGRTFRRMAEESCHWAIMDRQTVFALSSKYSVLLFQHIASLANLSQIASKTFTVPELRAVFGLAEGKIRRFADLNRDIIKSSIAEINQTSRLNLTARTDKVGRSVVSVTINWAEKELEQRQETRREMDRPKVGRKVRRSGTAETPVLSFPSSGSLKGDRFWEPLARNHVTRIQGGHVPDLRGLTDAFRNWCEAKGIPLNARGIENTFKGFCEKYKPLL